MIEKVKHIVCLFLLMMPIFLSSQTMVDAHFLVRKSRADILSQSNVGVDYAVNVFRCNYTSVDGDGNLDTLSGLMAVPELEAKLLPFLIVEHGTSDSKSAVPSNTGGEEVMALVGSGYGYISILPDYAGMGQGRGYHPYLVAESESQATLDFLKAAEQWLQSHPDDLSHNDQIFITGYSQGGHASMAFHRELETNLSDQYTVTAAAHLAGPYSMSGAMIDRILSNEPYLALGILPHIALGFQTYYGNMYNDLSDIFKPDYVPPIQAFYDDFDNDASIISLTLQLSGILIAKTGSLLPKNMLQDDVVTAMQARDVSHPFVAALLENDVYDWAPDAPTFIYYCTADEIVPYQNAIIADSVMNARGASDVTLLDINPNANHSDCAAPSYIAAINEFNKLSKIVNGISDPDVFPLQAFPNPSSDEVFVKMPSLQGEVELSMTDLLGNLVYTTRLWASSQHAIVSVSDLPTGLYVLQLQSGTTRYLTKLLVE